MPRIVFIRQVRNMSSDLEHTYQPWSHKDPSDVVLVGYRKDWLMLHAFLAVGGLSRMRFWWKIVFKGTWNNAAMSQCLIVLCVLILPGFQRIDEGTDGCLDVEKHFHRMACPRTPLSFCAPLPLCWPSFWCNFLIQMYTQEPSHSHKVKFM